MREMRTLTTFPYSVVQMSGKVLMNLMSNVNAQSYRCPVPLWSMFGKLEDKASAHWPPHSLSAIQCLICSSCHGLHGDCRGGSRSVSEEGDGADDEVELADAARARLDSFCSCSTEASGSA